MTRFLKLKIQILCVFINKNIFFFYFFGSAPGEGAGKRVKKRINSIYPLTFRPFFMKRKEWARKMK